MPVAEGIRPSDDAIFMSRVNPSLVISITLLILLAGATGAYLHYQLHAPGGAASTHARNFDYRRETMARPPGADAGQYRYFFATNRHTVRPGGSGEQRYGRGRLGILHYGSFDVTLAHAKGLGLLISPTRWLLQKEIRIDAVSSDTRETFIDALRAQVAASPERSLLVVIPGDRDSFAFTLRKTAMFAQILDLDTPILVFDWPGNQGRTFSGYRRAREVAEASAAELAQLLQLAVDEIAPQRLWLFANSLGAQVAADAFTRLMSVEALADPAAEFDHVVFAAPDVGLTELDGPFRDKVLALSRRLTVYASTSQPEALLARIVSDGDRVAEGASASDPLKEAGLILGRGEPGHDRVALVDATSVIGSGNLRELSLETPELFADLHLRLAHRGTPRSWLTYPVSASDGEVYWVLNRSR
jgi:esterase/lipase superfamily enzyme